MRKEIHTAEEIRAEVHRLLNDVRDTPVAVPLPQAVKPTARNMEANWDMPSEFRARSGYQIAIGLALIALKKRWDLDTR